MTSLSLREEFCWNRSNSYNLLTETRRVIKNMQTSAITKQTNINKKQTFNWLRHCKAACRGRPAILTAQLSKPCISWLPNLKSTGCQCFPDISNLLQDSYHASGASVFVHYISHQQVVQQYSCGGAVDTIPAPSLPRHQQNWLPCHCSWAASDEGLLLGVVILIEGISDLFFSSDTSGIGPTLLSIVSAHL